MKRLRLFPKRRQRRDPESGVALLVTISALAMLIALVAQFSYDTTIQLTAAANARDEVRAHYMARSAVSLSRLLIRIQHKFVEPIMQSAQQLLKSSVGDLGISLRVTDYAGPLMGFFGGSKEEVAGLGSLIGLDINQAKGLGMKSGRIDAEILAEDGKIDINCGSGTLSNDPTTMGRKKTVFQNLYGLFGSPRYNMLFQKQNADGQFVDRIELARAIIDWADPDRTAFYPDGQGGGGEDYRYDQRTDPYRAHDNSYESVDEVGLVYGMSGEMFEAFRPFMTAYASDPQMRCRVNLRSIKGECTPLLVGLIRAAVWSDPTKPPTDPAVLDERLTWPLASILCERGTAVGFDSLDTVVSVLSNPAMSISREDPRHQLMQGMRGINITRAQLEQVAYVGAPRVYRIVATGESGKVTKRITAVLDIRRAIENPLSQNAASERQSGVFQYWREE